jgi:hypothetical protein
MPSVIGVAVRVHSRHGDDLGVAHVPVPVEVGDALELGHGELLQLRIVDLVETGPRSPFAALVKVAPGADARSLSGARELPADRGARARGWRAELMEARRLEGAA